MKTGFDTVTMPKRLVAQEMKTNGKNFNDHAAGCDVVCTHAGHLNEQMRWRLVKC
jgi:hypothetical protein